MEKRNLVGLILIIGAIPLLIIGMTDGEREEFNSYVIHQSQIDQSQGLFAPYNIRPVKLGSSAFLLSGFLILSGVLSIYQGSQIDRQT
jgi:hypothetical protein